MNLPGHAVLDPEQAGLVMARFRPASNSPTMRRWLLSGLTVLLCFMLFWSAAHACSTCIRVSMGADAHDRRAWDNSHHVFVALVTGASIDGEIPESGYVQVVYTLLPVEVFKGDPAAVTRVSSRRHHDDWASPIRNVELCGRVTVTPGDNIVVFANDEGIANITGCGATRVLEGSVARPYEEMARTVSLLRRLRDGR